MKVKRVIPMAMALALMFTFTFCGMAFGEGTGRPPQCKNLPDPKTATGPVLEAFFTAAKDGDHFDLHILVEGEIPKDPKSPAKYKGDQPKIRRLFYVRLAPVREPDVCDRDDRKLMEYDWIPCLFEFQKPFNLEGIPVVKELTVERQEYCVDRTGPNRMIYGTAKIIVVPPAALKKK